ncbi:MAG: peptidoglycan DD-metalloendopeptidase family protein [Mariniphaga sp.]|nr:peptidoglycan DD-metalloendopeptidase family protein [Mariniphaga sp.]
MIKKNLAEIFLILFTLIVFIIVFNLPEPIEEIFEEEIIPDPVLKFGLPIDSFYISEGTIKRNQNLSEILTEYDVDMVTIDRLARSSRDTFDVRKIRTGQKYFLFQTADSLKKPEYFVYENSKTNYVVFELNDSLKTYNGFKEVEVQQKRTSGIIEYSLYQSIEDGGENPVLSDEMSKIYAWTIDFFGIQKGDRYRILYDEQFVDGEPIGIGEIHAAQFQHMGKDFYSFRYIQVEDPDYFDEEGKNLRKAFLKAPLNYSYRISGRFSYSRMHPILRYWRPHLGVDYAAPRGTPVVSIGDGTVISKAYQNGGGGNYLRIRHNSVYTTTYMHLSGYAKGIATGVHVNQGDVIGYVGATGLASGPHLDFRVTKNGQAVDPLKVEAPPGDSIRNEKLDEYFILKDSLLLDLMQIEWEEF